MKLGGGWDEDERMLGRRWQEVGTKMGHSWDGNGTKLACNGTKVVQKLRSWYEHGTKIHQKDKIKMMPDAAMRAHLNYMEGVHTTTPET